MTSEGDIRAALRSVIDPEVGMNIVDLGLVYAVRVEPGGVSVDLTMTSQACPMGDLVVDQAREAVVDLVGTGTAVRVNLVWDPPWQPAMMSEHARQHFGWQ